MQSNGTIKPIFKPVCIFGVGYMKYTKWSPEINPFNYPLNVSLCMVILVTIIINISCDSRQTAITEFDAYVNEAEKVWQFRGSFLVAKGDSILFRGSRGYANESERSYNEPETKFLIGSVTKPFTAIAVLQLVEKGLVDVNDPVSEYITDYPEKAADKITVHHLLAHRSGIPDVINNPNFVSRVHEKMTPQEIVGFFRDYPLDFTPGEKYAYSSSNYVLLGLIIEKIIDYSWEEYVHKFICVPAGMENTGVFADYAERSDFATGYSPTPSGSLIQAAPINPTCGYAAGSLASTVDDLFKLHTALDKNTLLDRNSVAAMQKQYSPTYGYGWLVNDFGGHRLVAHGGGVPGYVSLIQRWPDDSVCVIVLSNNVVVPAHSIANALAAVAMDEPYEMPVIKKPVRLESNRLNEYEGDYKLKSGEIRKVYQTGGQLMVQRSSGFPNPVVPEAIDRFFFAHDHMTTLNFFRDSAGDITGQILQQSFDLDTAWKIGETDHE